MAFNHKSIRLLSAHSTLLISRVAAKVFISAYLLTVTNNISAVALYSITYFTISTLTFIAIGPFCVGNRGLRFYQLGFAVYLAFYASLVAYGEYLKDYYVLFGVIYGLATGLYWLPFNIMKYEHNKRVSRKTFFSYEQVIEKAVNVSIPIIVGFGIWQTDSYIGLFVAMVVLFAIGVVLSKGLEWPTETGQNYSLSFFYSKFRNISDVKNINLAVFFSGFSFYGALELLIILLVFITQGNELRLGVATSAFPLLSILTALIIAHFLSPSNYKNVSWIGAGILLLAVLVMLFDVNKSSVILYGIAFAISMPILSIMQFTYSFNIVDEVTDLKGSKVEYFVLREIFINAGRIVSYFLLFFVVGTDIQQISVKVVAFLLAVSCMLMAMFISKVNFQP